MSLFRYHLSQNRRRVILAPLTFAAVAVASAIIPASTQAQVLCLQNLSYVSSEDGPNEAVVRTGCEGNIATVPHDPNTLLRYASVAPDGHTVAMALGYPASPGFWELFVGDIAGGPATQVTFMGGDQSNPTWSPDSRTIGFYHDSERNPTATGAYTINLDTQTLTRIAPGLMTTDSPGFSPDGKMLAVPVSDPAQGGMWAMSTAQPATPFPVLTGISGGTPAFTPDSQYLVFAGATAATDSVGLWTTDLSGHAVQLTSDPLGDGNPTVSNDWTAYFPAARGTDTGEHIYSLWLGGNTIKAEISGPGRQIEPTAFGGQATARPSSFPPVSSPPPPPPPAPQYVALGDSFSSGEGVPPFDPSTDIKRIDECHRSTSAYPQLLARDANLNLVADRACSGAVIVDVIGEGRWPGEPTAQVSALTKQTSIVTISIGGNDIRFGDVLYDCVISNCVSRDSKKVDRWLALLRNNLPDVYRKIQSKTSSSTRIFAVGYPQIFPDPNITDVNRCADVSLRKGLRITAEEMTWIRKKAIALSAIVRAVAKSFPGGLYIDPMEPGRSTFPGHELCTQNSWFNGIENPTSYSFHPNALGQLAYAHLIETYL